MRQGFDRSVVVGIAVLFLMIVGIAATSLINTRQMRFEADRVVQSQRVIDAIGSVHSLTRRTQAEQRGYLITGFDDRIEPYRAAAAQLREAAAHLAELTAEDPEQHPRALAAQREIESGLANLDAVVKLRGEPGGYEAVIALSRERGLRSYVDPFLAILAEMEEAERGRLAAREAIANQAYRTSIFSGAMVALLGVAAIRLTQKGDRSMRCSTLSTSRRARWWRARPLKH